MSARIITECRLCGCKLESVLQLGWTPLANALMSEPGVPDKYPLSLARCLDGCGHFQLPVLVNPDVLWGELYPYASGASQSMRDHLDEVAGLICSIAPCGRVLEIGCNDGYLLGAMQERGLSCIGIDPSSPDEAVARYPIIRERAELVDPDAIGEVDCCVALNVLAHIELLAETLDVVHSVLRVGGILVFEVGYFCSMLEQGVFDTIYHEHLDYHTLGSLIPLLNEHGLCVYHAERIASQGGSIRVYASKGEKSVSQGLVSLLQCEEETLSRVDRYVGNVLDQFVRVAHDLEGVAYVGYGCPAKATTLTSVCSLRPLAYIEDNPRKVGLWAPSGDAPIVANSAELDDGTPFDAVVVFAWNMSEEVLQRIRTSPSKMLRAARVYIPCPVPHWVYP